VFVMRPESALSGSDNRPITNLYREGNPRRQ